MSNWYCTFKPLAALDLDWFVITRSPVESRPPPSELPFPLSIRRIVALWDLLYLDTAPFRPDSNQSAQ
jgi:hypothetical protein